MFFVFPLIEYPPLPSTCKRLLAIKEAAISRAAIWERGTRRTAAQKLVAEAKDGVRDLYAPISVTVLGLLARGRRTVIEELVQDPNRIRNVNPAVVVGVAAKERGRHERKSLPTDHALNERLGHPGLAVDHEIDVHPR